MRNNTAATTSQPASVLAKTASSCRMIALGYTDLWQTVGVCIYKKFGQLVNCFKQLRPATQTHMSPCPVCYCASVLRQASIHTSESELFSRAYNPCCVLSSHFKSPRFLLQRGVIKGKHSLQIHHPGGQLKQQIAPNKLQNFLPRVPQKKCAKS